MTTAPAMLILSIAVAFINPYIGIIFALFAPSITNPVTLVASFLITITFATFIARTKGINV